jgi:hypothetical protein
MKLLAITREAGLHHNAALGFRQNPPLPGRKAYEESFVVRLVMREFPPVFVSSEHGKLRVPAISFRVR